MMLVHSSSSGRPPNPSAWTCTACTFFNTTRLRKCEICLTKRTPPSPAAENDRISENEAARPGRKRRQRGKARAGGTKAKKRKSRSRGEKSSSSLKALSSSGSTSFPTLDSFVVRGGRSTSKSSTSGEKEKPSASGASSCNGAAAAAVAACSSERTLWVDAHRPLDLSELAVHKKKILDVQSTLRAALQGNGHRIVVLSGPAGIGKSTLVRLLAEEFGVAVREWSGRSVASTGWRRWESGAWDSRKSRGSAGIGLASAPYKSDLTDFADFLLRANRYASLELSKSTTKTPSTLRSPAVDVLQQAPGSSVLAAEEEATTPAATLVMIDALPMTRSKADKARLKSILAAFANKTDGAPCCPAVVVFSEAADGGQNRFTGLRETMGKELLGSSVVRVIKVNPVADTLMKKALTRVAALRHVRLDDTTLSALVGSSHGDVRHAVNSLQFFATPRMGMETSSAGFGRTGGAASGSLGHTKRGKRKKSKVRKRRGRGALVAASEHAAGSVGLDTGRNRFLNQFHAFGKLLHAKRLPVPASEAAEDAEDGTGAVRTGGRVEENRGRLAFDPERVVDELEYDAATAAAFLAHNALEYYSDIHDFSAAADLFGTMDMLAAARFGSHVDKDSPIFPSQYVASLAGRTVAATNHHPAKRSFRSLRKPQAFAVERIRRENRARLEALKGDALLALGATLAQPRSTSSADAGPSSTTSSVSRRGEASVADAHPFLLATTNSMSAMAQSLLPYAALLARGVSAKGGGKGRQRHQDEGRASLVSIVGRDLLACVRDYKPFKPGREVGAEDRHGHLHGQWPLSVALARAGQASSSEAAQPPASGHRANDFVTRRSAVALLGGNMHGDALLFDDAIEEWED